MKSDDLSYLEGAMGVKHLDHLNLTVRDLEESLEWYGRVLGFERVEGGVQDGTPWAIARSGDALLCLYEHPDYRFLENDDRRGAGTHGMNHFGLRITDPEAWERTVEREAVPVHYGGAVSWPHSTAWYISDPTGYEIEVAHWKDDRVAF